MLLPSTYFLTAPIKADTHPCAPPLVRKSPDGRLKKMPDTCTPPAINTETRSQRVGIPSGIVRWQEEKAEALVSDRQALVSHEESSHHLTTCYPTLRRNASPHKGGSVMGRSTSCPQKNLKNSHQDLKVTGLLYLFLFWMLNKPLFLAISCQNGLLGIGG